ncbi:uncharacterized protein ACRADG_010716 [Cochliomyia hominivorax]
MLCLSKLLLHLVQYYSIIFGFTYIYIDFKNRVVKFNKTVKFYVYFIDLVFLILILNNDYTFLTKGFTLMHIITAYTQIIENMLRTTTFIGLIFMRIKEEKLLRKFNKIFTQLQTTYFDKLSHITVNQTLFQTQILNISLVMSFGLYAVMDLVVKVIIKIMRWYPLPIYVYDYYIQVLTHYVLFHHGFMLCCLYHQFQKINNHLKYASMDGITARVHLQLSLILKQVNDINGPLIFIVLLSIFLENGNFVCISIHFYINDLFYFVEIVGLFGFAVYCINIFLYFVICERIKTITNETGFILMEYREREDQRETEIMCFRRLMMKNNVNICGFFSIDLGSLFALIASIITLTIILIQSTYYM